MVTRTSHRTALRLATRATSLIACLLVWSQVGSAQATDSKPEYEAVPGQFVVTMKRSALNRFANAPLLSTLGVSSYEVVRPGVVLVQRPIGERAEVAARMMQAAPFVEFVEPNYIYRTFRTPNDPKYQQLWGLNNVGQADPRGIVGVAGVDIQAERAWDIQTGSKDVVVAVIDTGVDFTIPDLASNAWTNVAELNGQPGVDDDGNGFVDDVNGYDFAGNKGAMTDDNGHGSHCAGTIGGRGDDGAGVVGVAWNVSIMGVKFLDGSGGGTLANAVKSIDYARKNGAKIMSNSWGGGGPSETLKKAIEDARDAGILFIAAAGNDGSNNDSRPSYPASYAVDNIVSVAALGNKGTLASFSNFGARSVHVAAPGVNVLSTVPKSKDPTGFASFSGTSMATPHVSGVAALVLANDPTLTYKQLRERIIRSARPVAGLRGKVSSGGMVDAFLAVTGEMAPPDENDPSNWTQKQAWVASTDHPYKSNTTQEFTATVAGASKVAVHFAKFKTEANYDFVEFFDKTGRSLGKMTGSLDDSFSPVADGDTIVMRFKTDGTVNDYGFDTDWISYK